MIAGRQTAIRGGTGRNIQRAAKRGTVFVGNPNHTTDATFMTWDAANYGTEGPLKIGFQGYSPASNPSFMKAWSAIDVHPVHDQNGGDPRGIKQGTMTLDVDFERSSSFDSYYQAARHRTNLDVLERAIVAKLIYNDTTIGSDNVQVLGVTYLDNDSGIFHNVSCVKEVILSAGAFHSPFLLKPNGIGPEKELQSLGIKPIVVNENVGMHMQDHTAFSVIHAVKPEFAERASTTDLVNDITILNREQEIFYSGSRPRWESKWSAPSGCTNGFQEFSNATLTDIGAGDIVKAGLTQQAHNEILYESVYYPPGNSLSNTSYISITVSNMAALSRGPVNLSSRYLLSGPTIDQNYLAEPADQNMAIQGVKYLRRIMEHPEMSQWSAGEVLPGKEVQSDEDILQYARNTMIPNWHASSTCRMLPWERGGVVDSHLRVYGTSNLRICDVPTFGRLPDVNLVGPVYAVAELGAEIIRKDHNDWLQ